MHAPFVIIMCQSVNNNLLLAALVLFLYIEFMLREKGVFQLYFGAKVLLHQVSCIVI
jgi:hypothetical protein